MTESTNVIPKRKFEMNLKTIFEIFGINGSAAVRVGEETGGSTLPIFIVVSSPNGCAVMSPDEARYLADRLVYLANKIDKRNE